MASDERPLPQVRRDEGMTPVNVRMPLAPFGVGAFAIARNWSERRQLESLTRLGSAKTELMRVCLEQRNLLVDLGIAAERLENIDAIRLGERLRIHNEVAQRQLEADISGLQASVKIENLKAELAEAKQRRERIENPGAPQPPPKVKSEAEKLEEALAEINAMDSVLKAQRAVFVTARGGEENLSPEDRRDLERLDVARAVHIEKLYEEQLIFSYFVDLLSACHDDEELANLAAIFCEYLRAMPDIDTYQCVVGPKRGNPLLVREVGRRLGLRTGFVRHSILFGNWIEGDVRLGERVLLLDDIASDGELLIEAVLNLRKMGVDTGVSVVLVDRADGDAVKRLSEEGVEFRYVLQIDDATLQSLHRGSAA